MVQTTLPARLVPLAAVVSVVNSGGEIASKIAISLVDFTF